MIERAFEGHVDVEGGRLWAQWAGEGSGVVLIHAGIADARMWDPQWEALAASHRVARYDTRGFGRTETEEVDFSNRADAIAVMDAAGLERAVLVGGSRGGSIALDTALEYPDRVAGVAWVCGGISGLAHEPSALEVAAGQREEALWEARDWAALAELDVALWVDGLGQPAGRAPGSVRDAVRTMTYETYVQEKAEGRPITLDPPAATRLEQLACPVLLVVGLLDTPGTLAAAAALEARAPRVRRVDIDGVAHLPSLERPEWFTTTLLDWLREVEG